MIIETEAKSILRKYKNIDSWFITCYGMNIYRGCAHGCVYCDGRNEKYNVEGDFENDIQVKINAAEILDKELDPVRRRKPMRQSFITLGGGVGDFYQPVEKKYELSRKILKIILKYDYPVHILTKSILVKRDLDLIKEINEKRKAIVSFSISSTNNSLTSLLEPGASSVSERLDAVKFFKDNNIASGLFLMPVIPYITDTKEILKSTISDIKNLNPDYVLFSGMTLKQGRQKDLYYDFLNSNYPHLIEKYNKIYIENKWGSADMRYIKNLQDYYNSLTEHTNFPKRIPFDIYKDQLSTNDKVSVMLDQLDYLCKCQRMNSPYGKAAWSIRNLKSSIREIADLKSIPGIGKFTEKIIRDILKNGESEFYNEMLVK